MASFFRWYVTVELHNPAYAKRFYSTYELLEENMMKVWVHRFYYWDVTLFFYLHLIVKSEHVVSAPKWNCIVPKCIFPKKLLQGDNDFCFNSLFFSSITPLTLWQFSAGVNGGEDGFKLWQSLVRQTELTAQLCSITRDVRNVRGNTQKKIEKLRQLLSGLLSELTYFEEVGFHKNIYSYDYLSFF